MSNDPANDWLLADAESQGPRLTATCTHSHRHNAVACYEVAYGIILSKRAEDVHHLRDSDAPLYSSPDVSADPLDVVLAREELREAIEAAEDDAA